MELYIILITPQEISRSKQKLWDQKKRSRPKIMRQLWERLWDYETLWEIMRQDYETLWEIMRQDYEKLCD